MPPPPRAPVAVGHELAQPWQRPQPRQRGEPVFGQPQALEAAAGGEAAHLGQPLANELERAQRGEQVQREHLRARGGGHTRVFTPVRRRRRCCGRRAPLAACIMRTRTAQLASHSQRVAH